MKSWSLLKFIQLRCARLVFIYFFLIIPNVANVAFSVRTQGCNLSSQSMVKPVAVNILEG